jgi:hypothetical protein
MQRPSRHQSKRLGHAAQHQDSAAIIFGSDRLLDRQPRTEPPACRRGQLRLAGRDELLRQHGNGCVNNRDLCIAAPLNSRAKRPDGLQAPAHLRKPEENIQVLEPPQSAVKAAGLQEHRSRDQDCRTGTKPASAGEVADLGGGPGQPNWAEMAIVELVLPATGDCDGVRMGCGCKSIDLAFEQSRLDGESDCTLLSTVGVL